MDVEVDAVADARISVTAEAGEAVAEAEAVVDADRATIAVGGKIFYCCAIFHSVSHLVTKNSKKVNEG